eukprot:1158503-Pelagomonas_calceolata.AAC.10
MVYQERAHHSFACLQPAKKAVHSERRSHSFRHAATGPMRGPPWSALRCPSLTKACTDYVLNNDSYAALTFIPTKALRCTLWTAHPQTQHAETSPACTQEDVQYVQPAQLLQDVDTPSAHAHFRRPPNAHACCISAQVTLGVTQPPPFTPSSSFSPFPSASPGTNPLPAVPEGAVRRCCWRPPAPTKLLLPVPLMLLTLALGLGASGVLLKLVEASAAAEEEALGRACGWGGELGEVLLSVWGVLPGAVGEWVAQGLSCGFHGKGGEGGGA